MGRQSTGKSYMLNHLFGTSFEVSGGRCTDGCWMAVRVYENRLYVVLDFEGVGSVERTDQEDMLLSLFNASLSGCTLFRTENRVDRTMEEMFSRFQAGVGRMNWKEERLFKGSLLIIIKDVVTEWKDVFREFESKLNNILFPNGLQAEEDQGFNFISKMYGKRLEIVASPSLGDEEYYEILASIGETLQNKQPLFQNGQEFLELMKLIMARLHLTDCNTSLQGWELKMRLEYLNSHLAAAIYTGRLQSDDEEDDFNDGSLLCLESGEEIPYQDIISLLPEHHCLKSSSANLHLTDAEFTLSATNRDEKEVVAKLKKFLEDDAGYMRTGDNHEAWFSQLQSLLDWAAAGRSLRVEKWAKSNLTRFGKDGNEDDLPDGAKGVLSEVAARGRDLQQISSLCGQECSKCFLQCLLFRGHPDHEHDCFGKGDHVCDCACQWCKEDGKDSPCKEKMGHSGNHDCRVEVHTCTETCDLSKFRNCQGRCQKRAGHEGEDHQCNARHLCGENCLAHGCQGKCSIPSDQVHSVHSCQRGSCTQTCAVAGCGRLCSALDHFHNSQYSLTYMNENMIEVAAGVDMFQGIHYCGATHKCPEKCQVSGICSVERRFVMKEDEEYHGARSTFKYKAVLEDNGKREDCAIEIPKYRLKHDGDHVHSTGGNVVHTCMDKCPTCNYYCDLPMNHDGEHSTAHGNMRKSILISEDENIDIEARHGEVPELGNEGAAASDITMSTRKYKAGESGKAEMCDLFCKAMGRGHVHVIDCEESRAGRVCTHSGEDGRRHEKYHWKGKDDKLVDEVTHEAYWKYMGWKDPCHANDRQIFQKCPAECGMHEKNMAEGMARPACTLPIWHQPIIHGSPEAQALAASGYISIDGHHFDCSHLIVKNKVHSVLVLDESYSMEMVWGQLEAAVKEYQDIRCGINKDDRITIIQYSGQARVVVDNCPIKDKPDLQPMNGGLTDYTSALQKAYEVLKIIASHQREHTPTLLFMSDGSPSPGCDGKASMRTIWQEFKYNGIEICTIGLGTNSETKQALEELALCGMGQCYILREGTELKDRFSHVASEVGKMTAAFANVKRTVALGIAMAEVDQRVHNRLNDHREAEIMREIHLKEENRLREEAVETVMKIKKECRTNLKLFLERFGVKAENLDSAKRKAWAKFHPDKSQGKDLRTRVLNQEIVKVINSWGKHRE
eukprot:TRINITY_DN14392_c0_g2_i1.p1 TRINITY_DN14392_c0_g2~~TRINITY_DN14392_c0_g2_i1.p1  ORF type:complete len:1182 (-),score=229.20 TRINITY_DN14392_c0_g2_i1:1048-4593(-)